MLTARQAEVVGLIARGLTTPEIAAMLGISRWTVKEHRKAIHRNLNARNPAQAVAVALQHGLIVP